MVVVGVGGCFRFGCLEREAMATATTYAVGHGRGPVRSGACCFSVGLLGLSPPDFGSSVREQKRYLLFMYETMVSIKYALNPISVRQ
jgi:hypothetical protein